MPLANNPELGLLSQGLTRALAAEIGPRNIRVNVIVPGYIETDMTAGMFSSLYKFFYLGLVSRLLPYARFYSNIQP